MQIPKELISLLFLQGSVWRVLNPLWIFELTLGVPVLLQASESSGYSGCSFTEETPGEHPPAAAGPVTASSISIWAPDTKGFNQTPRRGDNYLKALERLQWRQALGESVWRWAEAVVGGRAPRVLMSMHLNPALQAAFCWHCRGLLSSLHKYPMAYSAL